MPTPESAAFLAKKPKVAPTFDGVDYDDNKALKAAQDAIVREQWVQVMMGRLIREELGKCYYKEGVNHLEKCGHLRARSFTTTLRPLNAAAAAPSPATDAAPASEAPAETAANATPVLSSCPKGTILKGLNYFKDRSDPVALADDAYPAWLWNCISVTKKAATVDADAGADEFSKSKKQRRLAAKKQRALEAQLLASGDLSALAPKIPVQQQSINLPGAEDGSVESAVEAAQTREALRSAMRKERKAKIRENNYLRSM
ncbi:hypothetical protein PpBr36_00774 [Pyricularia pennisetigena]|uniref:hypothetical protein n=1 Tax=Pyricularia pennisetigena TaxID=1578925 RepID=UPI00114E43F5|nr:hypothetical protein PpBr36_00774 [Pyricularia pennisetigena]TLS28825.1 hypothetical protein PpBr36_00774 [Pyricularia pennisetigena]